MNEYKRVIEVEWTEYEQGWSQRSDGYSYYPTIGEAQKYCKDFISGLPTHAPSCYVTPGSPRTVKVDPVFALLVEGKGIVWSDKSCSISID